MGLAELSVLARQEGNRATIAWRPPDPADFPGVRLVRREGAFPETPVPATAAEGVVVADGDPAVGVAQPGQLPDGRAAVTDTGLAAETVYYYQVYPYAGTPPAYDDDEANRAAVLVTGPYDFGGLLFRLLPGVYHRYDTVLPADVLDPAEVAALAAEDRERGQLRRFLDLPGGQLDQLYSDVRSLLDLHSVGRVHGRLLPLLAQWIGWRTDHRLGFDRQRAEIRDAPALYHTIETVPTVEATVRRVAGWEVRTKEYVDNVAATNRPERLNLWLAIRDAAGWSLGDDPLSLDDAHEGRPAAARDAGGGLRVVYHTRKAGRWELWEKRHTDADGWTPSRPVVSRPGVHKDPAVVVQGDDLWVFWSAWDRVAGRWRIDMRTESGGTWSPVVTFRTGPGDGTERRAPAAAVDGNGVLWLFWHELAGGRWLLRYAAFAGVPWAPTPAAAVDFPSDGGEDPRVDADVSVLFRPAQPGDPSDPFRQLWVLWARRERLAGAPEQTRWRVVSRFKEGADPGTDADWSAMVGLAAADDLDHDREPVAVVGEDGNLAAYWSSTRDGSWSVWEAELDVDAHSWGTPAAVTAPPFSERAPLAAGLEGTTGLLYRSNRSLRYSSTAYRATETTDRRYSGSTTVPTRNAAHLALRGTYDDFSANTYDSGGPGGRGDGDVYARDTIGLFIESGAVDAAAQTVGKNRLRRVLPEFLPATDRAVLVDPP